MSPLILAHHYQHGWLISDAEFDQPVQLQSATLLQDCITVPVNYHPRLRETWHISLAFITSGPGTDLAGPDDIKLLNRSGAVFCELF